MPLSLWLNMFAAPAMRIYPRAPSNPPVAISSIRLAACSAAAALRGSMNSLRCSPAGVGVRRAVCCCVASACPRHRRRCSMRAWGMRWILTTRWTPEVRSIPAFPCWDRSSRYAIASEAAVGVISCWRSPFWTSPVASRLRADSTAAGIAPRRLESLAPPAGKLIGLTPKQMLGAFGIAYSHAAGNRQCILDGALTKRMQAGQAASAGVFSAVLAHTGFSGARNIFSGRFGFFELYQPVGYDASVLLHDLGGAFRGEALSYKPYPCGRPLHAAIDAALAARPQLNIEHPDEIESVTIEADRV